MSLQPCSLGRIQTTRVAQEIIQDLLPRCRFAIIQTRKNRVHFQVIPGNVIDGILLSMLLKKVRNMRKGFFPRISIRRSPILCFFEIPKTFFCLFLVGMISPDEKKGQDPYRADPKQYRQKITFLNAFFPRLTMTPSLKKAAS